MYLIIMTQPISIAPQPLEIWLDEFVAEQMDKLHIPGVTFSLVQNGKLLLAKGYGYANLKEHIPVESDRTIFRVGSISKLFVATAIMQLVEKGSIYLHEDVNKYLTEFKIKGNYPQPVTIANLLTHTAGFDDRYIGIIALKADNIQSLGEHLAAKMPARVMSPGEVMSYSNYGYALLGYLVELAAGISFSQYVTENILQPLEMNHSSFEQPSFLANQISTGYRYRQKKKIHQALAFQYVSIPPAGSLSATATDMAKFAIAHLQHGKYKSTRILSENTAKQMHQQQFTHDPRLPGIGWGFMESFYDRQRAINHGGGMPGFASLLYLFPRHNIGLFVADNAKTSMPGKLIEQFCETARCGGFLRYSDCRGRDRFLPVEQETNSNELCLKNRQSLKRYEGKYRSNSYPQKTLGKIGLLSSSLLSLKAEADGTLKTSNSVYLQETEPLLLKIKDRSDCIVAQKDTRGNIVALLTKFRVLNKIAWYETKTFHWTLIWSFVAIFLSGSIFGVFALTKFPVNSVRQLVQPIETITCGLNLIFIAGMLAFKQWVQKDYRLDLIYGVPKIVTVLLYLPFFTSVLAITLPVFAILAWLNPELPFIEQIFYSIIAIASLGFIPFLNYWNLLGFRY